MIRQTLGRSGLLCNAGICLTLKWFSLSEKRGTNVGHAFALLSATSVAHIVPHAA
ncbi:MAG: hypothetical protein NTW21_29515 [Verrucomicrobia bacterium]|nr:hypothetical protein [Verrucomicrobiota bacterium]